MSAPDATPAAKPAANAEKYVAKYVRTSKVKELLVDGVGDKAVKIRVSGDAKDKLAAFIDLAVEKAVKEVIGKLPRKSKGDSKGELSRITIQIDDIPK